jgi:hypothetical protein
MARGDHIHVKRMGGLFTHHGIDCGDGMVIHFTGETWTTPRSVQRTSMATFARGAPVEIRDYREFFKRLQRPEQLPRRLQIRMRSELSRLVGRGGKIAAFEPDAVVARAESRLGRRDFNMAINNCEHFATWCKTGLVDSEQVYALWRSVLDPMTYLNLRHADFLTAVFEPGRKPRKGRT